MEVVPTEIGVKILDEISADDLGHVLKTSTTMNRYRPFFEEKLERAQIEYMLRTVDIFIRFLDSETRNLIFNEKYIGNWIHMLLFEKKDYFRGVHFKSEGIFIQDCYDQLVKAIEEDFNELKSKIDTLAIDHPSVVLILPYNESQLDGTYQIKHHTLIIGAHNGKYITYRDLINSVYHAEYAESQYKSKDEHGRLIIELVN